MIRESHILTRKQCIERHSLARICSDLKSSDVVGDVYHRDSPSPRAAVLGRYVPLDPLDRATAYPQRPTHLVDTVTSGELFPDLCLDLP